MTSPASILSFSAHCVCGNPECIIPYGYCHCACGGHVTISPKTRACDGARKGLPLRFKNGHNNRDLSIGVKPLGNPDGVPYGYCYCLCGEKTSIIDASCARKGEEVGEPRRFILNHRRILPNHITFSIFEGEEIALIRLDGHTQSTAIVSNSDLHLVAHLHWRRGTKGYAVAVMRGETSNIKMHNLILPPVDDLEVDHANRICTDNRRRNLRLATRFQQEYNKGLSCKNTSGYKGVSWSKSCKAWVSSIKFEGRSLWLGAFSKREAAARAYDRSAVRYHKEFAWLNFPEEHGLPART